MKNLLFVIACLFSVGVFGQGWEQTYGSGIGSSVQQTSDGGFIIAGWTGFLGKDYDAFLIKTDGNGVVQWIQTIGGSSTSNLGIRSVHQTTDGGYIIAGLYSDVYLIKTDGTGVEQWSQTDGCSNYVDARSVQQTTDGGYIIAGYATNGVYLIKTDGNGVEQWCQTYGGSSLDRGHSVQQTTDGGYIIAGFTTSFGNGLQDFYLIKTDGNGVEQWSQTYGGTENDSCDSVQQTSDGGYIIAGSTKSFGNGHYDVYLIKIDGTGVEQWSQTYGGSLRDLGHSVQQTTDGGFIIAGTTQNENTAYDDIYLIKTDVNGVEQWIQTIGGSGNEGAYSVQQTTDGGYIISGYTGLRSGSTFEVYLIKTDSEGTLSSSFTIPSPSSNRKLDKVVDVLGREVNHTTNQILFHIYDDGSVEKKFVVE